MRHHTATKPKRTDLSYDPVRAASIKQSIFGKDSSRNRHPLNTANFKSTPDRFSYRRSSLDHGRDDYTFRNSRQKENIVVDYFMNRTADTYSPPSSDMNTLDTNTSQLQGNLLLFLLLERQS